MAIFEKSRALIIGVGEYLNRAGNVPQTVSEAESIYAALCADDVAAYDPQHVSLLTRNTPDKPTLAGSTAALQVFPNSTVLIYLAGYGALTAGLTQAGFEVLGDPNCTSTEAELLDGLYNTMALAHAAILLLSPQALASAAVWNETRFLTGRQLLGEEVCAATPFTV